MSVSQGSVMVAVPTDYSSRYAWFGQTLSQMKLPPGSRIEYGYGHRIGSVRQLLAETFLSGDCEYLFFVDDDQVLQPDTVMQLVNDDVPVVSALILQRSKPFLPTAYVANGETLSPLDLTSVSEDALVRCDGLGTGAVLIRRDVFALLEPPFFKYTEDLSEDLYFSNQCRDKEIPMYVDMGCRVGHLIPAAIVPARGAGQWFAGIQLNDGTSTAINLNHGG